MRDEHTDEELQAQAKQHAGKRGHGPLSRHDMFLLDLHDQLKWVEYAIYRSQGGKPRKPEPTPRPGVVAAGAKKQQSGVTALNEAGLNHLQRLRAQRGG